VLPLSNPSDIQLARDLIANGGSTNQEFLVVSVAMVNCGINRNFEDPNKPLWSWHVSHFWNFTEAVPPEISASPSDVENNFARYESLGAAAFGNYTLVAEFGPELELVIRTNFPAQAITFEWTDVSSNAVYTVQGTNIVYTLEQKDSLNSTNWVPVPGGNWPMKTNQWSISAASQPSVFYRVKAEAAASS